MTRATSLFAAALLLASCRPDQVEHLKDTKRIAVETANWEVKRIMPADLLRATRWAGDSLTATADTLLRRTLARELAAGGVAQAAPFCRPENYPLIDSLSRVMEGEPSREFVASAAADTTRQISRPSTELFTYQRPLVLNNKVCLRCHGQQLAAADAAYLKKYPGSPRSGYALGQTMGVWRVEFRRSGVAEFYTMKTRKKWKPHKF